MKKLKKWIEDSKFSQNGFAKEMGITPSTMSRYVNNERKFPLKLAVKIEKFTKGEVKCSDLI